MCVRARTRSRSIVAETAKQAAMTLHVGTNLHKIVHSGIHCARANLWSSITNNMPRNQSSGSQASHLPRITNFMGHALTH